MGESRAGLSSSSNPWVLLNLYFFLCKLGSWGLSGKAALKGEGGGLCEGPPVDLGTDGVSLGQAEGPSTPRPTFSSNQVWGAEEGGQRAQHPQAWESKKGWREGESRPREEGPAHCRGGGGAALAQAREVGMDPRAQHRAGPERGSLYTGWRRVWGCACEPRDMWVAEQLGAPSLGLCGQEM